MNTIFRRSDFILCDIPVPKGYKQSQTHVGIAVSKGEYYLTTSPYPAYTRSPWIVYLEAAIRKLSGGKFFKPFVAEKWENPCLYIGINSDDKTPTKFKLLRQTPLMPPPETFNGLPSYNSDPDLCVVDGTVHVLNRIVYRTEKSQKGRQYRYETQLFHIYGSVDNNVFKYKGTELLFESDRNIISPCMIYHNGEYFLSELETNSYNDGKTFTGLFLAHSSSIEGFKNNPKWESVNVEGNGYLPWHMSMFQYKKGVYAIVACVKQDESHRCWQMLGEFSDDLTTLHIYQTPLTDYMSYRSSALVNDGRFILYNAVVHEKINGSKSVDGRDILVTNMDFELLVDKLRKAE